MDPNSQSPQGENPKIQQLEQDLANLSQQASQGAPVQAPPQPIPPSEFVTAPTIPTPTTEPAQPVQPPTTTQPPEISKKGSPILVIAIILALVAVLAIVAYVFGAKFFGRNLTPIACTQEAKLCPDGSSVGRTGPNCEFAVCPTVSPTPDITANWNTFVHTFGYSLKYPDNIKVIPMKNLPGDLTPADQYPDVMFSAEVGFQKPHLRILRLTKAYVAQASQTLLQAATANYNSNLAMVGIPATSIQAPKQDTFTSIPSVSYILKNKGFKSITDEYLGFDGEYHVVWLDLNGFRYFVYWTKDDTIDEIVSTLRFTTVIPTASPSGSPVATPIY